MKEERERRTSVPNREETTRQWCPDVREGRKEDDPGGKRAKAKNVTEGIWQARLQWNEE